MTYRPHALSVSAVQLYVRCPAQYEARYVKRLVTPTSPAMLFGTVLHRALEAEHRGEDSERVLVRAWNAANDELAASGQALWCDKLHALTLLEMYKACGLGGHIGIPERKFTLPFPTPEIPVPLTGYIDLLLPQQRRFREFKTTSSASWTRMKIQSEHQLHVYGWAFQRLFHHRAECAEYVIFRTDRVQVDPIEAVPSPDGFRLFEIAAAAVWRGIEDGRYDGCGVCTELCAPKTEKPSRGPVATWEEDTP